VNAVENQDGVAKQLDEEAQPGTKPVVIEARRLERLETTSVRGPAG
jgi:hypothetical protein